MNLQQLISQMDSLESSPPFDLWDPPFCGDIDMEIRSDGSWWYMGTPISRIKLVKLFASVLIIEEHRYYLKTPAEKVRIKVENTPFIIIDWQTIETDSGSAIEVTSNLDHKAILSDLHPLTLMSFNNEQPQLTVKLHRELEARVHRNVYYQWIEIATEQQIAGKLHLGINSGGRFFTLGELT